MRLILEGCNTRGSSLKQEGISKRVYQVKSKRKWWIQSGFGYLNKNHLTMSHRLYMSTYVYIIYICRYIYMSICIYIYKHMSIYELHAFSFCCLADFFVVRAWEGIAKPTRSRPFQRTLKIGLLIQAQSTIDEKNLHSPSERLACLGIMGNKL